MAVTITDGAKSTTQIFQVTLVDANPPTLSVSANNGTGAGSPATTLPNGTPATATLSPSAGTSYTGLQIGGYSLLYSVEEQLDLMAPPGASNYFFNSRAAQEEYLVSGNGNNPADGGYYILVPNGNLYAWDGNSLTTSEATVVASLGSTAYYNPTLLTNAAPPYIPAVNQVEQRLDLQAPLGTSNFFYNAHGAQEEYLLSGNGSNAANGGFYILMPNGNLYAWVGNSLGISLSNPPAATLPTAYYQNPSYLIGPVAPGVLAADTGTQTATYLQTGAITASISGNTLNVTDSGYLGTVLVGVTISDGVLSITQEFQVTFD